MFEGLDTINWHQLSHANGTAEDVPSQLKLLASSFEQDAENALLYFWDYLIHQGSQFEATPFVVPFLFEILEHDKCCINRELIDLLLAIAVGHGESFLPRGYELSVEETRFREESWDGLYSYESARDSYDAVRKRAGLFGKFISPDYDMETRLSATFAIAHFAEDLSDIHFEIRNQLLASDDEVLLHGLVLCYGMLCRFNDSPHVDPILPLLNDSWSKTLQVSAAIALITSLEEDAPEEAVQLLYTALRDAWPVPCPRENIHWWNEGDLLGYGALVLPLLGANRTNEIAIVLCSALKHLQACTSAIPQTLLDLLFPAKSSGGYWKAEEFSTVQRAALETLLPTNHWKCWMLDSIFLPPGLVGSEYQAALREFTAQFSQNNQLSDTETIRRVGNVSSWDEEKHWP